MTLGRSKWVNLFADWYETSIGKASEHSRMIYSPEGDVRMLSASAARAIAIRLTRAWAATASSWSRSSDGIDIEKVNQQTAYAFFAPQNTGADPFTSLVTFDRHAAWGRYCPSGILGNDLNAAAWNAIACL
jgi:hypothetical protein